MGIADRAGYPVLSVPAGFGAENSSTGADPVGVDFIGTACSEAELPDDGCVTGSSCFKPYDCNVGEPQS